MTMFNMNKCQEGLTFLLEKYNVSSTGKLSSNGDVIKIKNETIPLLPWRNERRFIEFKNLVNDGSLQGISVMRVCRIDNSNEDINRLIYRELDLCEWILGSRVESIFAISNGDRAYNMIAKLKSGIVCTIEVATTLSEDAKVIDKHEIIAQHGVACDRVVDTQVAQQSIYVFKDTNEIATYQDVDFELYDYSIQEVAIIRQAFDVLRKEELRKNLVESAKHLNDLVTLAQKSSKNLCNVMA